MKKILRKGQSLSSLHKLAWKLQSRYIRQKAANFQGNVFCFTCNKLMKWQEADLGHFRHLDALDFEKNNLRIQCFFCNRMRSGNLGAFAVKLAKEIGLKEVERLQNFRKSKEFSMSELREIIDKYKGLLKGL